MIDFDSRCREYAAMINSAADEYVSIGTFGGRESSGLEKMLDAMAYSLSNGGKRIRPMLVLEFCRVCGENPEKAIPFAVALEMIHTYSLIHDDLPCMDDDDMRRGKPSSHKVFGEANALLAGDGLLTLAFETALSAKEMSDSQKAKAGLILAKAAGCAGMIAGQVMDLANEERQASLDEVAHTDKLKTGELIMAAASLGCIAANADEAKISAAREYCSDIGLAFQIVDDILDVTSSSEILGKPVGSDGENGKSTYVSLLGLEKSKELAEELTEKAKSALSVFGEEKEFLYILADKLADRKN